MSQSEPRACGSDPLATRIRPRPLARRRRPGPTRGAAPPAAPAPQEPRLGRAQLGHHPLRRAGRRVLRDGLQVRRQGPRSRSLDLRSPDAAGASSAGRRAPGARSSARAPGVQACGVDSSRQSHRSPARDAVAHALCLRGPSPRPSPGTSWRGRRLLTTTPTFLTAARGSTSPTTTGRCRAAPTAQTWSRSERGGRRCASPALQGRALGRAGARAWPLGGAAVR